MTIEEYNLQVLKEIFEPILCFEDIREDRKSLQESVKYQPYNSTVGLEGYEGW